MNDQLEAIAKKYHDDDCDAHRYTTWESMLKAVTEAYELGRTATCPICDAVTGYKCSAHALPTPKE